jgi:hypothetical protein
MLIALATAVVGVAGFNYTVNPFGAWPNQLVNPIYRSTDRTRVAIPYLIRTLEPRILILGDSRAELGIPISQGYRDGFFNAAMLGARLNEVSALLKPALRNPRLRVIVWQLAFSPFGKRSESVYDAPTLSRLAHPHRSIGADTLLSLDALGDSLDMIERGAHGIDALPVYAVAPLPWPQDIIRKELAQPSLVPFFGSDANVMTYLAGLAASLYQPFEYSPHQVDLFKEIVARIHRAGVKLIIFLPPMSEYELETIRLAGKWDDFMRVKTNVAAVASYSDFSGYNSLARADSLYRDPLHFKPALGWAIMRRLLNRDCSECGPVAGLLSQSEVSWDSRNVGLNLLAAQLAMAAATRAPSKYSSTAAMALRQYIAHPPRSALDQ